MPVHGIEDDDRPVIESDLHARRVPPITDGLRRATEPTPGSQILTRIASPSIVNRPEDGHCTRARRPAATIGIALTSI